METLLERSGFECLNGYEELYKINKQGEIWSCWYKKIMIPQISDDGYLKITLRKNDESYKHSIHRLLALQYIPNPTASPTVDHIDRNKTNNCLENLRWATIIEQANNKSTAIHLKTEEEQLQRIADIRQYKANWARWKKLKTGKTPLIPIPLQTEDEKKSKKQENWKKWYEENKETLLQKQRDTHAAKEFTEEERQKERDRVKAYREANKEKVSETKKEYYEENKEELKEKMKASYEANKEERLAKQKAYYEKNKERINEARRKPKDI